MSANFTAAYGGFCAHEASPSAIYAQEEDLKERVLLFPQSHQGISSSVPTSGKICVKINRTDVFPCAAGEGEGNTVKSLM